jgi:DNA-binding NtrC family response regulator
VTRRVDVRLLSATNADLTKAIALGQFRQDLYYRINVVQLHVPALKERQDDILPLARHFLAGEKALSRDAETTLLQYPWPGNVRELQNVCQRALLLSHGVQINPADLGLEAENSNKNRALDDIARQDIERALHTHQGVVSRAAKALGITRQALYRRMEFYGIDAP